MNNNIFPCLWCDGDAKESAKFYVDVFGGKISQNTPMVMNIELFNQKFMLLNGGPNFKKNASISFLVNCNTEDEVLRYWEKLSEGGIVLMELNSYPWSKKYGWIQDKYGTTWQLYYGDVEGTGQKIFPTLMFMHENNGKAKQAMEFYTQIFPNSKIESILKYKDGGENNNEIPENVQHAQFVINNYILNCMDSSFNHSFDFSEGISLVVMTDTQEQTDYFWNSLISDGGRESMCGWLEDKYGVSWQITPKKLIELVSNSDPQKSQKAFQAMLQMKKIIIADIEKAYNS